MSQIRAVLSRLDHPDRSFASALVAGTNGKGSVAAMAERAVRAAGWRTGRYTSPHLQALEERVAVDGEPVDAATLDAALERVRQAAAGLDAPLTYFEATTAAALEVFRARGVEVAVLEVGLGGRLDATNAVEPVAGAIAAIDFDHMAELGHRLEDIAREKAGIARPGAPLVLAPNPPVVRDAVAAVCMGTGARFVDASEGTTVGARYRDGRATVRVETPRHAYPEIVLALRGRHQVPNALTAIRLLEEWTMPDGAPVDSSCIGEGLAATVWPGRLELLHWQDRPVLLDGAHNPAGARALTAHVLESSGRPLPFVVGIMADKAIDEMLAAFAPASAQFVFTSPGHPRSADPSALAARSRVVCPDVPVLIEVDPIDALTRAIAIGVPVVVAGSLFLVGRVRPHLT